MSDDTLEAVKRAEGFRGYVYDDANGEPIIPGYTVIGHPTLWYGLCVEKGRVPPIPQRIPDELLEHVLSALWLSLTAQVTWLEEQPEDVQGALKEMTYNLGVAGVMGFQKLLAALHDGDRESAARHALDSQWAKQLPARADRLATQIRGHA